VARSLPRVPRSDAAAARLRAPRAPRRRSALLVRDRAAPAARSRTGRRWWLLVALLVTLVGTTGLLVSTTIAARPAAAQEAPSAPTPPTPPTEPGASADGQTIQIDIGGSEGKPSQSVVIILGLTVLALAPSLLIMLTSFTRIIIVLTLTRNALGLQGVPPNQVLTGLALFLSLFIMSPTLSEMNEKGLQPYLDGQISQSQAWDAASAPLKDFMLENTRSAELKLIADAADEPVPEDPHDISLTTVIPAFILSELKTAFIIGFVVFIPFIVIDLVVSSVLMSLGMMMLPPVTISLPFKVLLFVMVGGWSLVVQTLLAAYH
jgi:flagellar biosynthetic protein FliP